MNFGIPYRMISDSACGNRSNCRKARIFSPSLRSDGFRPIAAGLSKQPRSIAARMLEPGRSRILCTRKVPRHENETELVRTWPVFFEHFCGTPEHRACTIETFPLTRLWQFEGLTVKHGPSDCFARRPLRMPVAPTATFCFLSSASSCAVTCDGFVQSAR